MQKKGKRIADIYKLYILYKERKDKEAIILFRQGLSLSITVLWYCPWCIGKPCRLISQVMGLSIRVLMHFVPKKSKVPWIMKSL